MPCPGDGLWVEETGMPSRAGGVSGNGRRDIRIEAHQLIGQFLEHGPCDFGAEIYFGEMDDS
jgi:hypothetical protein